MAVTVPARFQLLQGRDTTIERGRPILALSLQTVALNAHWLYGVACRRRHLNLAPETPITSTNASDERVCVASLVMSERRERRALRIHLRYQYAHVTVRLLTTAGFALTTVTRSDGTGSIIEESVDLTAPGAGNVDLRVEVLLRTNTGATASLYALAVDEQALTASELP